MTLSITLSSIQGKKLITLSLSCLHGMRSSGELFASPQSGHSFFSELIRESLAHSSHMGHPHSGIIIASYRK